MKQSRQNAVLCLRTSTTAGSLQRRHFIRLSPEPPLITGRISIRSWSATRSSRVRSSRSRITSTVSGLIPSSPRTAWTFPPPPTLRAVVVPAAHLDPVAWFPATDQLTELLGARHWISIEDHDHVADDDPGGLSPAPLPQIH